MNRFVEKIRADNGMGDTPARRNRASRTCARLCAFPYSVTGGQGQGEGPREMAGVVDGKIVDVGVGYRNKWEGSTLIDPQMKSHEREEKTVPGQPEGRRWEPPTKIDGRSPALA